MLEPILQQVGQGNPQLAALISQNPDAFLQLLSEGADGDDDGEALPPGGIPISVTQEEAEAIDRVRYDPTGGVLRADCGVAMRTRVPEGNGHPGVLCVRQERGADRKLPLRQSGIG